MPKYRQLHVRIIDSQDVADMPDDFTRLTWILLMLIVDSEGRAPDNSAWIRSKMFPYREDVTLEQVAQAMGWFERRGMITRYQADGRYFFALVNWKKYQSGTDREAPSSIPAPELLPTYSRVTPDLLPLNTIQQQQQYNSNSNTTAVQSKQPAPAVAVASNVFSAYSSEIGAITALISEELQDAEKTYSEAWVIDAIHEAVLHNARSWKYCAAVLKRWQTEGRGNGKKKAPERDYVGGELGRFINH